jgi:hypothetical protein
MNRLKGLVDSYRLATERPPPPGQILVHNQGTTTLGEFRGTLGFRARWATPGEEFCECGWRPGLGEHYQRGGVLRTCAMTINAVPSKFQRV